jgi:flavorubredoxin
MACDVIEPTEIDVSGYDFLIFGTPVWAWKPTPAINAAVNALNGCENKKAVIFTTCCNQPGEALSILKKSLEARNVRVMGEFSLNSNDTKNPDAGGELLRQIIQIDPFRDPNV